MEILSEAMPAGLSDPFWRALGSYDLHFGRALANCQRFLAVRWDSDGDLDFGR